MLQPNSPIDPFSPIAEIMQRRGVRCSIEEFHSAVNVTFHQFESAVYDEAHQDMWDSLPRQFALLAADCLSAYPNAPEEMAMLDIGCGTGLASDSILKSALGPRIRTIHLLDTSAAMLQSASNRAKRWPVPAVCHEGTSDSLPPGTHYDLIVASSVLHHVPDLSAFSRTVRALQADGGIFLHVQDPNADFLSDADLKKRTAEAFTHRLPDWVHRLTPRRILGRIHRELTGKQGDDYLSKTNRELMRRNIVSCPLAIEEIFAITDIHATDGQGISIGDLQRWLPDYKLLSRRSYGYFGLLESVLPRRLKDVEEQLIASRALNGQYLGAAWRLDGSN
jgi:2-polyprenyl-3-methyl-5-hydroxy-6-metoxy-1,4-benzoquinol methylase